MSVIFMFLCMVYLHEFPLLFGSNWLALFPLCIVIISEDCVKAKGLSRGIV